MGIPGLYKEIGTGQRIALAKLAHDHYRDHGRKFRLAIDASIWLFQIKSGRGGSNPQIRTLYYRLLKLLRLGIDAVFVFDGPGRPTEKRNKKVTGSWESPQARQSRTLLNLLGFAHHRAPGEAEAECALLQMTGVVDAVLSEDVDTLMFGATLTLRNWSSQGDRTCSHVNAFYAKDLKEKTFLDRQAMILVALMSGADYDTVGLKKCGTKVAYEAAKAGFGHDLCNLDARDTAGLEEWRQRLQYELHSNESGFFRTKHPKIEVPPTFPKKSVLQDYMHPLVSTAADIDALCARLTMSREPDVFALRVYVAETFAWDTLAGAKKYIRGLAPALLTHQLLTGSTQSSGPVGLVSVCAARTHHTSDGIVESRVRILPINVVPLDLEHEVLTRPGNEEQASFDVSDSETSDVDELPVSSQSGRARSTSPVKKRGPSKYDPNEADRFYVAELYVRHGALEKVEAWETAIREPKLTSPRKARANQPVDKAGMRNAAIDSFFPISKSNQAQPNASFQHSPAKKARPVMPVKSKSDMSDVASADLRSLWKDPTPTWAEQQVCEYLEKNQGKPLSKLRAPASLVRNIRGAVSGSGEIHGPGKTKAVASKASSRTLVHIEADEDPLDLLSSPMPSQELIELSEQPTPLPASTYHVLSNARVRESLEGSWAHTSPQTQRRGTRLTNIETIDLT